MNGKLQMLMSNGDWKYVCAFTSGAIHHEYRSKWAMSGAWIVNIQQLYPTITFRSI